MSRILVVTADVLGERMAGPAIRAFSVAVALATEHDVHLVSLTRTTLVDERIAISAVDPSRLCALARQADVVIAQGDVFGRCPAIQRVPTPLVCDMYDPIHLEQLEQARDLGEDRRREVVRKAAVMLNAQLMRGDFFLCASERQRDFWLGQLAALGRVNPVSYDDDPTLRRLIDVVPFGTEATPPVRTRDAIKGVLPGIARDDRVVLWGGGVYNWFDPLTLVEAVHRVRERQPRLRLVFLGMRHPNADMPEMRTAWLTRSRSDELGLTGDVIHFNEQWVAYDDRANYLLDSDIGVTTHLDHIETAFSFRTRVLDYLWAGLPVLTTRGDTLAGLVEAQGLGLTVPAQDVDALAGALDRLLSDAALRADCRRAAQALAPTLIWDVALAPLVRWCRRPRRAPDLVDPGATAGMRAPLLHPRARLGWLRADTRLVRQYLAEDGPRGVATKAVSRLRHRARGRR
ncbi:MAG TPA: glycosyltransferase family 4 protein [Mycobacteriales bacterium]|nr:glycosyltransferase family 4 protein [Mycobacteriales bacterium]